MKPILFNTAMVQAILSGQKTTTRRIVKNKYSNTDIVYREDCEGNPMLLYEQNDVPKPERLPNGHTRHHLKYMEIIDAPYEKGDILYVRETWLAHSRGINTLAVKYKADGAVNDMVSFKKERFNKFYKFADQERWQPSLFMPKEAARIFLRVKNVRFEKLRYIEAGQCRAEGIDLGCKISTSFIAGEYCEAFGKLWDSTVNKKDMDKYSWNANPWVWVIEFEKIDKSEVESND